MVAVLLSPAATSESNSSHLPANVASSVAKPVTFPPGRSSRATMPVATGSVRFAKTIGIVFVAPDEHADAPHAVALLRARREGPCHSAAERSDECSPSKVNAHLPLP